MSKKSLKVDDLLDIVQDERIVSVLTTRVKADLDLTATIKATIEASFNKMAEKFLSKLENMVEKMVEKYTNKIVSKSCEILHAKIAALEDTNSHLKFQLEESEKTARLNNIVIHGIPESPSGSETGFKPTYLQLRQSAERDALVFFTTHLQVPVTEADISFAYRIPTGTKDAPRPLIVGFVSRRVRDTIFAARKSLRGHSSSKSSSIYINDHLTRSNSLIFSKARRLLRDKTIHSTWISGGNVMVRWSDSLNEKPLKVVSLQQLDDLLPPASVAQHTGYNLSISSTLMGNTSTK